ncbi:MAG: AarF/ABC1/UbiB kinase family protein, partial [Mesorhizobium sp.]|nr:AarF/ABC1/UbiB kinase family protein [Mesorhizobium sp.]
MPIFRLFRITLEVLRFMWDGAVGRLGLSRSVPQAPERLRLSLERLGTTFIKLGQALSMRRDVLP